MRKSKLILAFVSLLIILLVVGTAWLVPRWGRTELPEPEPVWEFYEKGAYLTDAPYASGGIISLDIIDDIPHIMFWDTRTGGFSQETPEQFGYPIRESDIPLPGSPDALYSLMSGTCPH